MEATLEGSVFSLTLKRTMCSMALDLVDIISIVDLNGEERRMTVFRRRQRAEWVCDDVFWRNSKVMEACKGCSGGRYLERRREYDGGWFMSWFTNI